ncbi:hypothetical protein GUJ93_ZPchr0002g23723 [Zizania palustris]|uniref:RWP-RK domain-containing protein n=1 Tax=Zizania palustris TaxID=103762 RepID=A0A8J5SP45_ZIZPA|nr:hypothetical protein GUJ93_ZPchr0002g23723 [Zizania palustris]
MQFSSIFGGAQVGEPLASVRRRVFGRPMRIEQQPDTRAGESAWRRRQPSRPSAGGRTYGRTATRPTAAASRLFIRSYALPATPTPPHSPPHIHCSYIVISGNPPRLLPAAVLSSSVQPMDPKNNPGSSTGAPGNPTPPAAAPAQVPPPAVPVPPQVVVESPLIPDDFDETWLVDIYRETGLDDEEIRQLNELTVFNVPQPTPDAQFIPYNPQQFNCSECRVLRAINFQSDVLYVQFRLHCNAPGIVNHASIIINRALQPGQQAAPTTTAHFVMDLLPRSHAWIGSFVWNVVRTLQGFANGQLRDEFSSFIAAVSGNAAPPQQPPPLHPDPYIATAGLAALQQILQVPPTPPPPPPPQPAPPPSPAAVPLQTQWAAPAPAQAAPAGAQAAPAAAAAQAAPRAGGSQAQMHRKGVQQLMLDELEACFEMNQDDAARRLNVTVGNLKRLVRKSEYGKWPARKLQAINSRIRRAEEDAGSKPDMLRYKKAVDNLKAARAKLLDELIKLYQDNTKEHPTINKGGGNNNRQDPPSPGGGGGAGAGAALPAVA